MSEPPAGGGEMLPPQNLEAEESVLGAMMVSQAAIDAVSDVRLDPGDFYRPRHRTIFEAIRVLDGRGEPVDALTVSELLQVEGGLAEIGGSEVVSSLAASTPAPGNAGHYGTIVKQNAILRRLLEASQRIQGSIYKREGEPSELVEKAEQILFNVARADQAGDFSAISDILVVETERLEKLASGEAEMTGTPSGFTKLDELTGGFQPGNLIILAARPAMGKSALVCNIAENVAWKAKKPVAFFSLEMSETELAHRFIASRAKIFADKLRKGQVTKEWNKVLRACNELAEAPLWIDDSSDLSMLDLRAKARRLMASTGGLGLIIVDYIQLMRPDDPRAGRVEQVGQMSRGLKILARELQVPVIGLSQLSRAPEQRPDKVPQLSDLRESGCLAGGSLVFLPDEGVSRPMADLVAAHQAGGPPVRVLAINRETWKLEPKRVTNAFCTGTKEVYALTSRLGHSIKATENHRFLTVDGWRRLDELAIGTHIGVPRRIQSRADSAASMGDDELALLGHLIGDGCTLPKHTIQYTTKEQELAEEVVRVARSVFGDRLRPRVKQERTWLQVYLPSARRLTHGRRNPISEWLDGLGVFGLRSHEKRVPEAVFAQAEGGVTHFLRHLWATDGCLWRAAEGDGAPRIYYATTSRQLAGDVQGLLLRLGIVSTIRRTDNRSHRPGFQVDVAGGAHLAAFVEKVGAFGKRRRSAAERIRSYLADHETFAGRDVIPRGVWDATVRPAMAAAGLTTRQMQARLDTSYCGSTIYKSNVGIERAKRVAGAVDSTELMSAEGEVYWDQIVSIEEVGAEPVYDLTVEDLHSFVAEGIIVHNSIEQDADIVGFIYRDEYYYKEESEKPGVADLVIAKHRNGPIGNIALAFQEQYPRFINLAPEEYASYESQGQAA